MYQNVGKPVKEMDVGKISTQVIYLLSKKGENSIFTMEQLTHEKGGKVSNERCQKRNRLTKLSTKSKM